MIAMVSDLLQPRDGLIFRLSTSRRIKFFHVKDFNADIEFNFQTESVRDLILEVLLSDEATICRYKTLLIDWINLYKDSIFLEESIPQ